MNLTRRVVRPFALLLALACGLTAAPARAELTSDQQQAVGEIAKLVREAAKHYQAGDFQASGQQIEAAMDAIDQLLQAGDPAVYDALAPAVPRIINAHALLDLEGVKLRPFERPTRPAASSAPPAATMQSASAEPTSSPSAPKPRSNPRRQRGRSAPQASPAAAGPSFVSDVAPILVQHCGRCHIQSTRGNFNMATFALLAKGPPEGQVIFPGDIVASRLIETIETGDMPRGGGSVPAAQLQTLKDWVAAGAKFDGASPQLPLVTMAAAAPAPDAGPAAAAAAAAAPAAEQPKLQAATGKETVSFAKDIAPLLLDNCTGCHIDATQTRGGLRLDNFAALLRGGDSGALITPPQAAESLLVRKLKGEEGMRMPAGGRPPLSDEAIGLISTWIAEGAVFDGDAPEQPLQVMAALAWAGSASEEELNERRMQTARKHLQLVSSGSDKASEVTSDAFYVLGNAGDATVQAVAAAADKAAAKIKAVADPKAIRGRVTIFVLPRRYDYSEFARMVEQRSLPADWQSHWKYDGVDAYIAVLATARDEDATLQGRLVGPLASLATAMRGKEVPRWFAEGAGRAAAARLAARDLPNVETWNRELLLAIQAMKDGAQLVQDRLPPEQTDLIGYGILSTMLGRNQRRQYDQLLKALESAPSFEAAFTASFGVTPAAYVDRWKPFALSAPPTARR